MPIFTVSRSMRRILTMMRPSMTMLSLSLRERISMGGAGVTAWQQRAAAVSVGALESPFPDPAGPTGLEGKLCPGTAPSVPASDAVGRGFVRRVRARAPEVHRFPGRAPGPAGDIRPGWKKAVAERCLRRA